MSRQLTGTLEGLRAGSQSFVKYFSTTESLLPLNVFFKDSKEAAIRDCSSAIELKPGYIKALLRRGQAYEDSDRPHEAMKDFEKALEIDPDLKEARVACMVSLV